MLEVEIPAMSNPAETRRFGAENCKSCRWKVGIGRCYQMLVIGSHIVLQVVFTFNFG